MITSDMNVVIGPDTETSVSMYFGDEINEIILWRITLINQALREKPFAGFIASVPAYTTLTVYYDPLQVMASSFKSGVYAFERVTAYLEEITAAVRRPLSMPESTPVMIPVCYGGKFGPDLDEVAEHNGLTTQEVIRLHSEAIYTVYMVGFMPGFAYLGGMDEKICMPRRPYPRKSVAAGSVGIAGVQTGIYPLKSPGGWQIIGRTPMLLFDAQSDPPALLHAGSRVRFLTINSREFHELSPDL